MSKITKNNDGRPDIIGAPAFNLSDVYHWLIARHWWQIVPLLGGLFLSIAFLFALLYWLGGDCVRGARPGSLEDDFYFSVQTLATIGYGGMLPDNRYANYLVCVEAFAGLMGQAVITGLTFAKFSVPRSHVIFSKNMTISKREGRPALAFRLANARGNYVVEARCKITLLRDEVTAEGESLRRLIRLNLAVEESPIFALSFTGTHYLDGDSPLAGWTQESMAAANCQFAVTMMGLDETLGQTVHARWLYRCDDILWGQRLADITTVLENGRRAIDYGKFDDTIPWQL